jgi:hypothetical protein
MQPLCTPTLAKFYSCKKKVLQIRAFTAGCWSSFDFDQVLEGHRFLLNLQEMDLEWREEKLPKELAWGLYSFDRRDLSAVLEGLYKHH